MNARRLVVLLLASAFISSFAVAASAATLIIVNKDAAGVGFNDPTPATPIGGNSGTTLGQQRLNVFQGAANIWGSKLSSTITIRIAAHFGSLTPCGTTSGVLGSAGPTDFLTNFPNAPRANTYYPIALASALAGVDYATTLALPDNAAIEAQFNSNIGTAGCLPTLNWYLGLDDNFNHSNQLDLETVLLHEFGHGLGFTGLVDLSTGAMPNNTPDIYSHYTFDNSVMLHWDVMSNAQRLASTTNDGNVVFDGPNVTGASGFLTAGKDGLAHPRLYAPSTVKPGSSVFHFDTACSPNLLMEPNISLDLTHSVDLPNDLTMKEMLDIGWQAAAAPPACTSFQISPSSATPGFAAGSQNVTITAAPAGCQGGWLAAGNGSWLTVSPGSGNGSGSTTVSWTQNNSFARAATATIAGRAFSVNQGPSPTATRVHNDFNADTKSDIIWRNAATGDYHMWFLNSNAIAGGGFLVNLPSPPWILAGTGDFDGDGKADLLWRNTSTGDTHLWLMNGNTINGGGFVANLPAAWVVAGTGDFNGDGKSDILWRNTATGDTHVWLMNANAIIGGG
ncbi:MAG TPA: FG-GAP-like repeat-containing protein, partial [Thermoanaerobaculia bacterium]|nr:FG-GAP-like repeat-containing protein [Thermoanaerobaculia bacterium]